VIKTEESKLSFFEKKDQKTFMPWLAGQLRIPGKRGRKSFLVLFFKKGLLAFTDPIEALPAICRRVLGI
jgi:hypothetical protein